MAPWKKVVSLIATEKPRILGKSRTMILHRLLALLLLATPACATQIELTPATSTVGIRFYGLGLLAIDGNYTRFSGRLSYDPADRSRCQVDLTADTASLAMANTMIREELVGPEFMDTARYPTLDFTGTCQGPAALRGALTMHGITHGFELTIDWLRNRLVATGRLHRTDWGLRARMFLGGSTVRIQVSATIPADVQGAPGR